MCNSVRLGVVGSATTDIILSQAVYEIQGRKIIVKANGRTQVLETETVAQPGDKVQANIPPELWQNPADHHVGGGGPNSCMACKLVDSGIPIRYLDLGPEHRAVKARLGFCNLETRFLGLTEVPRNIVLGAFGNRLIVKPRLGPTGEMTFASAEDLDWVTDCGIVLGNSVKRLDVAQHLARASVQGRCQLHIVLTPYLPRDFVFANWLPAAATVYASQDEIGRVTGWNIEPTVAGAVEALDRLCAFTRATIFVTRGEDGVVVSVPGQEPLHVRLEHGWKEIQEHIAKDSTVLCGAGDAFAAGATMHVVTGRSLAGCLTASHPRAVAAAVSGSALAVRWTGWVRGVRGSHFSVSPIARRRDRPRVRYRCNHVAAAGEISSPDLHQLPTSSTAWATALANLPE